MTNIPRQAIRDITAKYGIEICSNSKRCEGLLRDKCGSHRREISILINALEEHVPLDLMASKNSVPRELLLNRLAKRLEENLALTEDAAVWAVESWALALNIITDEDVAERGNKQAKFDSEWSAKVDFDSDSKNRTQEIDHKKLPPEPASQKPPSAQKQSTKTNRPPVFAPPSNPLGQGKSPIGTQPSQMPTHPVPTGQALPHTNQAQTKNPPVQVSSKKRSWKLRGCFIGCFLLLILLGVLVVGLPYAVKVMRETQQSSEPPVLPPQ